MDIQKITKSRCVKCAATKGCERKYKTIMLNVSTVPESILPTTVDV